MCLQFDNQWKVSGVKCGKTTVEKRNLALTCFRDGRVHQPSRPQEYRKENKITVIRVCVGDGRGEGGEVWFQPPPTCFAKRSKVRTSLRL